MTDIIETATICTAFAAITGAFVSGVAFITTQLIAPAIAEAAMYASSASLIIGVSG